MLVYGDHDEAWRTADLVANLQARLHTLNTVAPGLAWHGAAVSLLWGVAGLYQGIADASFTQEGWDEHAPWQQPLTEGLIGFATAIVRSWSSGFTEQRLPDGTFLTTLPGQDLPEEVCVRRCEGYSFYAVYPELYARAARAVPGDAVVIGLRSIGCGLGAIVAAAAGAKTFYTLRPTGDPFARAVKIGPELRAALLARRGRNFVIVDEGPGLSGSSFGGVADWLESEGVPRANIIFMPSHKGDLGPMARPYHRLRWGSANKPCTSFEEVFTEGERAPLAAWFEDISGPAKRLTDLSGGAWRGITGRQTPADPRRECRKFLLEGENGAFLLRFIGLDTAAGQKFERARKLHDAGFGLAPLALRYGFMAEPWDREAREAERSAILARLPSYLRFRAETFPATRPGATLHGLAAMARQNIGESIGPAGASLLRSWTPSRLDRLQPLVRAVHTDGRLHPWEWLITREQLVKTDALDHSSAHDLIGCQDIAWDVAGAIVEYDLNLAEQEALMNAVLGGRKGAEELTRFLIPCYLGFQAGWWSFSTDRLGHARQDFYRDRLLRMTEPSAESEEQRIYADVEPATF
jgi:hypothetical protein